MFFWITFFLKVHIILILMFSHSKFRMFEYKKSLRLSLTLTLIALVKRDMPEMKFKCNYNSTSKIVRVPYNIKQTNTVSSHVCFS